MTTTKRLGTENSGRQFDRGRQDEHFGKESDATRQREKAAKPCRRTVLGNKQNAKPATVDERGRQRRPSLMRRCHRDGCVRARTSGHLLTVSIDEMNRIVVYHAARTAGEAPG